MDRECEILHSGAHLDRERGLGDQLGGVSPDDLRANDRLVRAIEHKTDIAFRVAKSQSAPDGRERRRRGAYLDPLLLRLVRGSSPLRRPRGR